MEPDELESAAIQEDAPVPAGLEDRIMASLAAKAILQQREEKARAAWIPYAAVAFAAAIAALAVIPRSSSGKLKDTFDDPYLAYAQVEATFQRISDKMAAGVDLAAKADETAEKTIEIINKLSE